MKEDLKRAMKMLSTALEMEERRRTFYEHAVSICKNDMGKEIFQIKYVALFTIPGNSNPQTVF